MRLFRTLPTALQAAFWMQHVQHPPIAGWSSTKAKFAPSGQRYWSGSDAPIWERRGTC
jgi:hypothetical protein